MCPIVARAKTAPSRKATLLGDQGKIFINLVEDYGTHQSRFPPSLIMNTGIDDLAH